jgi:acetyl-CoA C-acetyltransferase
VICEPLRTPLGGYGGVFRDVPAAELGLRPLGRLVSWAVAGVPPATMGIGPVPATARALSRAGLKLDDINLIELNEAFAARVLACLSEWGVSLSGERLNANGSGISLGHPVGATGCSILATMLRERSADLHAS